MKKGIKNIKLLVFIMLSAAIIIPSAGCSEGFTEGYNTGASGDYCFGNDSCSRFYEGCAVLCVQVCPETCLIEIESHCSGDCDPATGECVPSEPRAPTRENQGWCGGCSGCSGCSNCSSCGDCSSCLDCSNCEEARGCCNNFPKHCDDHPQGCTLNEGCDLAEGCDLSESCEAPEGCETREPPVTVDPPGNPPLTFFGIFSCPGSEDNGNGGGGGNNDPIQTTNPPTAAVMLTMELDKEVYSPGDTIVVTVRNLPRYMHNAGAFVAIYEEDAGHYENMEFMYPDRGDSIMYFTSPNYTGRFEMRLYNQDEEISDNTLEISVIFTVR